MVNKEKISISVEDVSYAYEGTNVLQQLSFEVRQHEIVVIIGPSGCGKTTLLNILAGYNQPTAGIVHTHGVIRTVHQQDSLFPWLTVSQNIGMGLGKSMAGSDSTVKELVTLVGMEGFENHYPYQLSGGMKQRVELGRILAGESDIILMDEPFSSLDYLARMKMRRELIRLLQQKPKTVILVTHDIEEAVQIADRILILSNRPTYVCHQLNICQPHPRSGTQSDLIEAMETIINTLGC